MVSAVAAAGAVRDAAAPAPVDGHAALARLQHQLSDNVHCASAKTPEGKATIAAIEDQIAALKARMDGKPTAVSTDATAPSGSTARSRPGSASGGVIDVYA